MHPRDLEMAMINSEVIHDGRLGIVVVSLAGSERKAASRPPGVYEFSCGGRGRDRQRALWFV